MLPILAFVATSSLSLRTCMPVVLMRGRPLPPASSAAGICPSSVVKYSRELSEGKGDGRLDQSASNHTCRTHVQSKRHLSLQLQH